MKIDRSKVLLIAISLMVGSLLVVTGKDINVEFNNFLFKTSIISFIVYYVSKD